MKTEQEIRAKLDSLENDYRELSFEESIATTSMIDALKWVLEQSQSPVSHNQPQASTEGEE